MDKQHTPKAIMLVGVPGSGKSTWSKTLIDQGYRLVSSDEFIEQVAAKVGKTYSEVFMDVAPAATRWMNDRLDEYTRAREDIIWDQTNLSPKARANKLRTLLKAGYEVTAVAFEISDATLAHRRTKRERETGKTIAPHILANMAKTYARPTTHEGFSKVIIVNG